MTNIYTVETLESQRTVWKAKPIKWEPLEIEELEPAIQRAIALGLVLELPVAGWVGDAVKFLQSRVSPATLKSMGKNINDERNHYNSFMYASAVYTPTVEMTKEADAIAAAWDEHPASTLMKAATSESGVFLPSLFLLSQFGGHELANIGTQISEDEFRHVVINWNVLKVMGEQRSAFTSLRDLRLQTLEFIFRDVVVPDMGIDLDFMLEQSDLLVQDGHAPELQTLSRHAVYMVPFENENEALYK
jgi:hypothetical protein